MPRNIMSFDELSKSIGGLSKNKFKKEVDPRFYNLKFDDQNHGSALIRFLPPKIGESNPIVKTSRHFFRTQNGWFVEPCPRTIGNKCPICEHVHSHWQKGSKDPMQAKTNFYANILVLKDPLAPANEGKVFILKFGKEIFNMISEKIQPTSDIDKPVNIFDYDKGLNFKLKATLRSIPGFLKPAPNYRESTFDVAGPIVVGDTPVTSEFLDTLDDKIFSLKEFVDPSQFKNYEDLQEKFSKEANVLMDEIPSEPSKEEEQSKVDSFANGADTMNEDFFNDL